jgi:hypothetical protein
LPVEKQAQPKLIGDTMKKYDDFDFIRVDDTNADYHAAVVECLNAILELAVGKCMLIDMNLTQKVVEIVPTVKGKRNQCNCTKSDRFVTLVQAFQQSGGFKIKTELKTAIDRAGRSGVTKEMIAMQLGKGLSPVTVHTDQNVAAPGQFSADAANRFKGTKMEGKKGRIQQALNLIEGYLTDDKFYFSEKSVELANGDKTHTHRHDLIRILKPYCDPGKGAPSKVFFDPTMMWSCDQDQENTMRPPAIALAHELCHAWRNAAGLRFFDDRQSNGLNDDEVMTTGLPPYGNERYSENLFRSQWAKEKLEMRTDYRTYGFEKWQAQQIPGNH